ncbi:MAG: citrate/2-methylcitrate synthase, partial [Halioglobus sp.]|nr:citrate/2-methylcitrate synthase [Halioglobus sp.]
MPSEDPVFSTDLAGIIVGETTISDVQGEIGLLSYRGIDINDMVGVPFLHVVWMVLFGEWPAEQQKSRLKAFMCRHSHLSRSEIDLLQQIPNGIHPMLMLQGLVPLLTLPEEETLEIGQDAEQGLFLAAKISALVAARHRLSQNKVILQPV